MNNVFYRSHYDCLYGTDYEFASLKTENPGSIGLETLSLVSINAAMLK